MLKVKVCGKFKTGLAVLLLNREKAVAPNTNFSVTSHCTAVVERINTVKSHCAKDNKFRLTHHRCGIPPILYCTYLDLGGLTGFLDAFQAAQAAWRSP